MSYEQHMQVQPPGGPPPSGAIHVGQSGGAPPASMPSAPPMEAIGGYGNTTFNPSAPLPPPSYDEASRGAPPERGAVSSVTAINEEIAREALLEHVSQHCCYGKGAAKKLTFVDLKPTSAFHYTLETFGESRITSWAMEPYSGQPIDGPHNGPAPGPWDMQAQPTQKFKDATTNIEVPHTASVKPCHECVGIGRVRCDKCLGQGRVTCLTCHGSGHQTYHEDGHQRRRCCTMCDSTGRKMCDTCHATGQITCKLCQGRTQLKCYIKLTIRWINHFNDYILEETDLPDELIRNVTGQVAFEEELPRVWAVNHFPDHRINTASRQLVDQHGASFPTERILLQRQRVRIVPVTEALYKWKGDDILNFFIYGFENKVHAPTYPQRCCWGCNIL